MRSPFGNGSYVPGAASDPERDVVTALERWVEKGIAPERLIGTGKSITDTAKPLTRPLCMYPKTAKYDGKGDPNDAGSFACN